MNSIMQFTNTELGAVRIVVRDGEPWFAGKDVSIILGYTEPSKMYRILDDTDMIEIDPQKQEYQGMAQNGVGLEPNKHIRNLVLINEAGLYTATLRSNLPGAKAFKRWVTSEVLPSIRRHGGYLTDNITDEQANNLVRFRARTIATTFSKVPYHEFEATYTALLDFYKEETTAKKAELIDKVRQGVRRLNEDTTDTVVKFACSTLLDRLALDYERYHNYANGNEKRVLTNQNKRLTAEVKLLRDQLGPEANEFVTINYHGFSNNHIHGRWDSKKMSRAYGCWRANFPYHELPPLSHWNLDPEGPIDVFIGYRARRDMDIHNFDKTAVDAIFKYYGLDDNRVDKNDSARWGNCGSFKDGRIYFYMRSKRPE